MCQRRVAIPKHNRVIDQLESFNEVIGKELSENYMT